MERWQQSLKPYKLQYQQHRTVGSSTRSVEEVLYQKCQQEGVTKCLACRSFSSLTVWVNFSKGSEKLLQLLQQGAFIFFLWELLHVSFYWIFTWSLWKSANALMPVASQQSSVHFSGFFFTLLCQCCYKIKSQIQVRVLFTRLLWKLHCLGDKAMVAEQTGNTSRYLRAVDKPCIRASWHPWLFTGLSSTLRDLKKN